MVLLYKNDHSDRSANIAHFAGKPINREILEDDLGNSNAKRLMPAMKERHEACSDSYLFIANSNLCSD